MRGRNLIRAAFLLAGCRDAVEPKNTTSAALSLPAPYEIVELGTLGGAASEATGMNERSQIIGVSQTAAGATHAFFWQDGVIEDLGTLGGDYSAAAAINIQGDVAGVSSDTTGAMRIAVWVSGTGIPTDLGPALGQSSAVCLSDGGYVAWAALTPTGIHAMLWDGSQAIDLGTLGGVNSTPVAVNARGQVVGTSTTATGQNHAFLWENGAMRDLGTLGGSTSEAKGINEQGIVIGSARNAAGSLHAFRWDGEMTDLGVLPGDVISSGAAVNERDQIVGTSYRNIDGVIKHAFIWELGVMRPLMVPDERLAADDRVRTLNDNGQVIGVTVERNRIDHPWLWDAGVLWDLPTLGEQNAVVAIDNTGNVAGWSSPTVGIRRAVLWRRTTPLP